MKNFVVVLKSAQGIMVIVKADIAKVEGVCLEFYEKNPNPKADNLVGFFFEFDYFYMESIDNEISR